MKKASSFTQHLSKVMYIIYILGVFLLKKRCLLRGVLFHIPFVTNDRG